MRANSKNQKEQEIIERFNRLMMDYSMYGIYNPEIPHIIESEYALLRKTDRWKMGLYNYITFPGYSEEFIESHFNDSDFFRGRWELVTMYQVLSEKFIDRHKDDISWECVCLYQPLEYEFIMSHSEYIWWDCLAFNSRVNKKDCLFSFIDRDSRINTVISLYCPGEDRINTTRVMSNIIGSSEMEDIIYKYKDLLSWSEVFKFPISEKFIIRCREFFGWNPEIVNYMLEFQKLRPEFIDTEILGRYNGSRNNIWYLICRYQRLPQYFMIVHDKDLNWECIKKYQKYDEDFKFLYRKELGYV